MAQAPVLHDSGRIDLAVHRDEVRRALDLWTLRQPAVPRRTEPAALAEAQALVESVTVLAEQHRVARRAGGAPHPLAVARRVDAALERLRAAPTLQEFERSLPSELSWAGGFDRVLFSRIEMATWRPVSWFSVNGIADASEDRFRELVRGPAQPLQGGTVEAEVVRRRVSALVLDAHRTTGGVVPIIDVVGSDSYVVAPVLAGDRIVGMIHADIDGGRTLVEADRVAVQCFADGVGLAIERMSLTAQLLRQRDEIRAALDAAAEAVDQLTTAPVAFVAPEIAEVATAALPAPATYAERLTDREREVFDLLVAGATNGQIADRLTVSETTVKSHVKHILRKLRVANRAEAIAQFVKARAEGCA